MTVTVFRSTDAGAPSLSGSTAGSLIAVLDFCLLTTAGWAKEFAGASLAVYRAPSGLRQRLRVDDSGVARISRLRAYAAMSDVNTGTDGYPTVAQDANGNGFYRSSAADAVAKPWSAYVSERSFYLVVQGGGVLAATQTMFFGDLISYKPGDAYHSALLSDHATLATGATHSRAGVSPPAVLAGHYICRAHGQAGTALQVSKSSKDARMANSVTFGSDAGGTPYPDPITGGIKLGAIELLEPVVGTTQWSERGRMPGLYSPMHIQFGAHLDTFTGTGRLAGKNFELLSDNVSTTVGARVAIQTNGSWY